MPDHQTTVTDEADFKDAENIRRMVAELNSAIVAANERGLRILLGIQGWSTKPPHNTVSVIAVERPRRPPHA